jgi:hypothetical protein
MWRCWTSPNHNPSLPRRGGLEFARVSRKELETYASVVFPPRVNFKLNDQAEILFDAQS